MKKRSRRAAAKPPAGGPQPAPLSETLLHRIALIVLFLLPFVFYWKYLTGSPMLYGSDWLSAGALAMRDFMAGHIRSHGAFAYWIPEILSGQPTGAAFFGDMFHPATLVRLILPIEVVWTWSFILHIFLAGLGTYLFLRELKVGVLPAGLGGIAYMFAGSLVTLTLAGHDGRLIGSALLPLVLFFLHRGMNRRQLLYFLLAGLMLALQLLSGHLQKVYYTGLVLVAYFIFLWVRAFRDTRSAGTLGRLALYFLLGIGFGVALSAVQYLPVYGNMPWAARGAERGYEYATSWSMPIIETFDLITPRFSGGLHSYWGQNPFKLHSEYLGILPLLFAAIAVFRRWRDRYVRFFSFTFLGTLLMAWGGNTPFYYIPYYLLPGVSMFRGPAMIFYAATLSLAVLAGFGIDHLLRPPRPGENRTALKVALVAGALPLFLLLLFGVLREPMMSLLGSLAGPEPHKLNALAANYPALTGGMLFASVVAAFGVLLAWFAVRRRIRPVVFAAIAATVMVLDIGLSLNLWDEDRGYIRGVPPTAEYLAADEAVAFLQTDTSLFRVLPLNYDRSDEGVLLYHGIHSAGGQLPNPLQTYQDFIGAEQTVMFQPTNLVHPNFADLLNTKYVLISYGPGATRPPPEQVPLLTEQLARHLHRQDVVPAMVGDRYAVFRLDSVLPRAFLVPGFEIVAGKEELITRLLKDDFDPSRTVLLYQTPDQPPAANSPGTARVISYGTNRIVVLVATTTPQLLVLSENYHPEWRATVNGEPAVVLQAYHTLRAIPVPAGEHEVVLYYDSRYYTAGGVISLLSLLCLVATAAVNLARRRGRRRRTT